MYVTRRYWAVVAIVLVLVVGSIALGRPLLFVGASMIGAWVIGRQYVFIRALTDTVDALALSQEVVREHVTTDQPVPLSLAAALDEPSALKLSIEAGVPAAATTAEPPTLALDPGETGSEGRTDLSWSVAGTFRFDPATVVVRDPYGLFEERVVRGPTPTVTVEPREPRDVHLGKAGEHIRQSVGTDAVYPLDIGIDPAELREYQPGDPAKLIDWNATARLNSLHVQEREPETGRRTVLVFDHRDSMAEGPEGATKLDYARHVALSLVDRTQRAVDPLGLYTVDDDGTAVVLPTGSTGRHYATIRDHLHRLTERPDRQSTARTMDRWAPPRTRRIATRLSGDDSAFAGRLRPYAARETGRHGSETDPLFATVRAQVHRSRETALTVIVTDDTDRTEVRDAVLLAREASDRVHVVLTPTVLFEPNDPVALEAVYDRYSEFERFRRSLDRMNRISAMELAPSDRLAAVLAAGQRPADTGETEVRA